MMGTGLFLLAAKVVIGSSAAWVADLQAPDQYWHIRDVSYDSPEAYLNAYRASMGLDAFTVSAELQASAAAHAAYLAQNGTDSLSPHRQDSSADGFTGQWPDDRCKAEGYELSGAGMTYCTEIQAGGSGDGDLYSAIDALMMTPFHRTTMINPLYKEIGCAMEGGYAVCDIGLDVFKQEVGTVPAGGMIYPADGQVISTTFYAVENPVPYPNYYGEFIGPTIMYWPFGVTEPEARVTLYDLTSEEIIDHVVTIDTAHGSGGGAIFANPVEPLELDHEYAVLVEDLSGAGEFEDISWTFKTQSSSNVDFPNITETITYEPAAIWAGEESSTSNGTNAPSSTSTDASLIDRLAGNIMLLVDYHGEAWYIDPVTRMRYYLKDGPTAYEFLRTFGLGITNADLARIPTEDDAVGGGTLATQLSGRILIQVEEHGEAWYVNPADLKRYYLKDGEAAYAIMRELSVGTLREWMSAIPMGEVE
jgi:hypothetical protein